MKSKRTTTTKTTVDSSRVLRPRKSDTVAPLDLEEDLERSVENKPKSSPSAIIDSSFEDRENELLESPEMENEVTPIKKKEKFFTSNSDEG